MEDALHVYSAEVENLDPQIGGAPPEFDPLEFEPGNIKSDPIRNSFESPGESDGDTGSITEITDQIRRWAADGIDDEDTSRIVAFLDNSLGPYFMDIQEIREVISECIPWVHVWKDQSKFIEGDVICAVVVQQMILQAWGINVPVDDLVVQSLANGSLTPGPGPTGGMIWEKVGGILDKHEIAYEKHHHGAIEDIERAHDQNRLVAVPIDADDLWDHKLILEVREVLKMDSRTAYLEWKEKWLETFPESQQEQKQEEIERVEQEIREERRLDSLEFKEEFRQRYGREFVTENHILLVSKIDRSDPDNPMVYVIDSGDSGTPNGKGKAYPLKAFIDAWEDSEGKYLVTKPVPNPSCLVDMDQASQVDSLRAG